MTIIFIIKELRNFKNITIEELSEATNLPISYISAIEENKIKDPSFSSICKIAVALNENVEDIFFVI